MRPAGQRLERLCDPLERDHLRDQHVHRPGEDGGTVLQRPGHAVGEASPGLGEAAWAALDLGVELVLDGLEDDYAVCVSSISRHPAIHAYSSSPRISPS